MKINTDLLSKPKLTIEIYPLTPLSLSEIETLTERNSYPKFE